MKPMPCPMRRLGALAALAATFVLVGCSTAPDTLRWSEPAEAARAGGDLGTAVALYEAALEQVPDDPALRARLASLLLEQADAFAAEGRFALAEDRYMRARETGGSAVHSASVLMRQADARRDAGRDWPHEAELLEEAFALADLDDDASLRRSLAWRLAIGWDEAREGARALPFYAVLLAGEVPLEAPVVLRAAQLQDELGMDEAAGESYRRYLSLEPGALPGIIGLAGVLERGGQLAEAEALLVELADGASRPGAALRTLRGFYQRTGNRDGVAQVEARLAELNPDAPERRMRPLKERR